MVPTANKLPAIRDQLFAQLTPSVCLQDRRNQSATQYLYIIYTINVIANPPIYMSVRDLSSTISLHLLFVAIFHIVIFAIVTQLLILQDM